MGVTGDVPSREGLVQRAQGVGPVIWGHLPPFAGSDWGEVTGQVAGPPRGLLCVDLVLGKGKPPGELEE